MEIKTTPLEPWIKHKITGDSSGVLTRKQIEDFQLTKLQDTLNWVTNKSKFYKRLYSGLDCKISSLQDILKLPFTTSE